METTIYATFILIGIIEIYFFGMQRFSLLISRELEIDPKLGRKLMLPDWFSLNILLSITKYGIFFYSLYAFDWKIALGLFALIFLISAIVPIPYKFLYTSIFSKTLEKRMFQYPDNLLTISQIKVKIDFE